MLPSKQVDAYIAKSALFAQPILSHLRELVHQACPEGKEVIKWGFPCFEYKGMLCNMAAFKQHCAFGFWKASLIKDPQNFLQPTNRESMGNFHRITSLKDLPPDKILLDFIRQARELNEKGIKREVKNTPPGSKQIVTPVYFKKILKQNKKAETVFEKFSYSHRKEYIQWFEEAKAEDTRIKRMVQALAWIAEGKGRNWKYGKK